MMLKNLKEAHQTTIDKVQDFYTSTGIHVYVKERPTNDVNIEEVVSKLESVVPEHLLTEVEMIVIGWFEEFEKRELNAFYSDGCLYVSPLQDNESDLLNDLVHETSHSIEELYGYEIYGDKTLENEFLKKRLQLRQILWAHGYKTPSAFFTNTEYDLEFDNFLLNKVGYDKLALLAQGIYVNPYAATSLREYFATGFTDFFLNIDREVLKVISPVLYEKLLKLNGKKSS